MTLDPAILTPGSIIRVTSEDHSDEDQDFIEGRVACIEGDSIAAEFPAWFEIWDRDDLHYDAQGGIWRPLQPGSITDRI